MIRFGSRGSDLALTQTRFVAEELKRLTGVEYSIEVIKTRGDKNLDDPLPQIGGKGLFTAELEAALREQRIDIAVHSLKDLPVEDPDGLTNGAIPARERVHDVLIFDPEARDPEGGNLPLLAECVIGTSSPRRSSSILSLRADLEVADIRGNVESRARKVAEGQYDATILAGAGLARLGLQTPELLRVDLPVELFTPAPGQGALGIQCRTGDSATRAILANIHDQLTADCVNAERRLLWLLGGGCSMPLGALLQPDADGGFRMLVSLFSESQPSCGIQLQLHGEDAMALADEAAAQLRPLLNDPLLGRRVVLLRPGGAGGQLSSSLGLAGAVVETVAVSEILPLPMPASLAAAPRANVAFTSARAVDRFFEEAAVHDFDLAQTSFFAVGPATALAVLDRGHSCSQPQPSGGGRELAAFMAATMAPHAQVFYPCAEDRHPDFEADLRAAGHQVQAAAVYRTCPLPGLEIPAADHLVFTSPSAVQAFTEHGAADAHGSLLALGQTTANAMQSAGLSPNGISKTPTAQALVSLIQGLSSDAPTPTTTANPGDS